MKNIITIIGEIILFLCILTIIAGPVIYSALPITKDSQEKVIKMVNECPEIKSLVIRYLSSDNSICNAEYYEILSVYDKQMMLEKINAK